MGSAEVLSMEGGSAVLSMEGGSAEVKTCDVAKGVTTDYEKKMMELASFAAGVEEEYTERDDEMQDCLSKHQARVVELEGVVHDLQVRERAYLSEISKLQDAPKDAGGTGATSDSVLSRHLEHARAEAQDLRQQICDLQGALESARLRAEAGEAVKQKLEDSEQKSAKLERSVAEERQQAQEADQRAADLDQVVIEQKEAEWRNLSQIAELQDQLNELQDQLNAKPKVDTQRVATLETRCTKLQELLDESEQCEEAYTEHISKLQAALKSAASKAGCDKSGSDYNSDIADAQAEVAKLKSKLTKMQDKELDNNRLKSLLTQTQDSASGQKDTISSLSRKLADAEALGEQERSSASRLREELGGAREAAAAGASFAEELANAQVENQEMRAKLEQAQSALEQANTKMFQQVQQLTSSQENLWQLQQQPQPQQQCSPRGGPEQSLTQAAPSLPAGALPAHFSFGPLTPEIPPRGMAKEAARLEQFQDGNLSSPQVAARGRLAPKQPDAPQTPPQSRALTSQVHALQEQLRAQTDELRTVKEEITTLRSPSEVAFPSLATRSADSSPVAASPPMPPPTKAPAKITRFATDLPGTPQQESESRGGMTLPVAGVQRQQSRTQSPPQRSASFAQGPPQRSVSVADVAYRQALSAMSGPAQPRRMVSEASSASQAHLRRVASPLRDPLGGSMPRMPDPRQASPVRSPSQRLCGSASLPMAGRSMPQRSELPAPMQAPTQPRGSLGHRTAGKEGAAVGGMNNQTGELPAPMPAQMAQPFPVRASFDRGKEGLAMPQSAPNMSMGAAAGGSVSSPPGSSGASQWVSVPMSAAGSPMQAGSGLQSPRCTVPQQSWPPVSAGMPGAAASQTQRQSPSPRNSHNSLQQQGAPTGYSPTRGGALMSLHPGGSTSPGYGGMNPALMLHHAAIRGQSPKSSSVSLRQRAGALLPQGESMQMGQMQAQQPLDPSRIQTPAGPPAGPPGGYPAARDIMRGYL